MKYIQKLPIIDAWRVGSDQPDWIQVAFKLWPQPNSLCATNTGVILASGRRGNIGYLCNQVSMGNWILNRDGVLDLMSDEQFQKNYTPMVNDNG